MKGLTITLIEVLKVQHNIILRQLEYLEKLKSSVQKDSGACCLKQVLLCIVNTVDDHAKIEEKFLFPELETFMGEEMSSPAVMKFEHEEIRGILTRLQKTDAARGVLLETAKFIVFLRDHIEKEEKVIFPTADKALGREASRRAVAKVLCFSKKKHRLLKRRLF